MLPGGGAIPQPINLLTGAGRKAAAAAINVQRSESVEIEDLTMDETTAFLPPVVVAGDEGQGAGCAFASGGARVRDVSAGIRADDIGQALAAAGRIGNPEFIPAPDTGSTASDGGTVLSGTTAATTRDREGRYRNTDWHQSLDANAL